MSMTNHLLPTDKYVAIVTGAGSGIGAATARLLGERGMVVILVGRRQEKLSEVARAIEAAGGEAMTLPADLALASAPGEIVERALARFWRIDVLINNAAGLVAKPFDQFTLAEFDEQVATNVRSVFFLIQAALPALRRSPAPAIVNLGSSVGSWVRVENALYSLTKAAVEHLTRCLAAELASDGIGAFGTHGRPGRTRVVDCSTGRSTRVLGHGCCYSHRWRPDLRCWSAALISAASRSQRERKLLICPSLDGILFQIHDFNARNCTTSLLWSVIAHGQRRHRISSGSGNAVLCTWSNSGPHSTRPG